MTVGDMPPSGDNAGNVAGGFTFASSLGATNPLVANVAWQDISSSATYCSATQALASAAG